MSEARRYNPALLPPAYAKWVLTEWCRMWFTQNGIFRVDPNAAGGIAPPPLDAEGRPTIRENIAGMFIREEYAENLDADKTTGIVVSRGRVAMEYRGGVGQLQSRAQQFAPARPRRPGDTRAPEQVTEVGEEFTDLISIPFTCWCLSRVGREAEEIGSNVFFGLAFCRKQLPVQYPAVHDIGGLVLGVEEPVRQATTQQELVGVQVSGHLELQYFWQVYERGDLPLRFINFGVQTPE